MAATGASSAPDGTLLIQYCRAELERAHNRNHSEFTIVRRVRSIVLSRCRRGVRSWHGRGKGFRSVLKIIQVSYMPDTTNSPTLSSTSDIRGREEARVDAMQEDLLRRARQRSVHRIFIEAALQRAGRTAILGETVNAHQLHSRTAAIPHTG